MVSEIECGTHGLALFSRWNFFSSTNTSHMTYPIKQHHGDVPTVWNSIRLLPVNVNGVPFHKSHMYKIHTKAMVGRSMEIYLMCHPRKILKTNNVAIN